MSDGPTSQPRGPLRGPAAGEVLRRCLEPFELPAGLVPEGAGEDRRRCPVHAFAASGAMAMTGWPLEPTWPDADPVGALEEAARLLERLSRVLGRPVSVDVGRLLCARALTRTPDRRGCRRGTTSFGGACRLVPAAAGWVALNLGRPEDADLLPALTGGRVGAPVAGADLTACWEAVADEVARRAAVEFVEAAAELGLPASVLGEAAAAPPFVVRHLGSPGRPTVDRATVVDFSALWAGPLCAHLLGRAGARVVTVEAVDRPDGARRGDPRLHAALHRGHGQLRVDLADPGDRRRIDELVAGADVVIEASRPRALAALGLDPGAFLRGRAGRTWVSVTGHGRAGPGAGRVAFGDDAAVAGALVGRDGAGRPTFCADAVADPVTGLLASVAALASRVSGGGHLVECSMAGASAWAAGGGSCPAHHRVEPTARGWTVFHADLGVPVVEPWLASPASVATLAPAGAAVPS